MPDDFRRKAAWAALGIDYNPDAAFVKKAAELNLGRPVSGESEMNRQDGLVVVTQCYERGFLHTVKGVWANLKAYDYFTGDELVPPVTPPGGATPPPSTFHKGLTTADMPDGYGYSVTEYKPAKGEVFWRLVYAGDFKVGTGTEFIVTTLNQNGVTAFGVPVVHAWDLANHHFKVQLTDGAGQTHIILGKGSDYTPSPGFVDPDYLYVCKGDGADGADGSVWPKVGGDLVHFGEPGGHASGTWTFQEQIG